MTAGYQGLVTKWRGVDRDCPCLECRMQNQCADELAEVIARNVKPSPDEQRSQVQSFGGPRPKTWADYRKGCLDTYGGGYRSDDGKLAAFHHGIETVFNLLEAEFPPAEQCKCEARPVQQPARCPTCRSLKREHRNWPSNADNPQFWKKTGESTYECIDPRHVQQPAPTAICPCVQGDSGECMEHRSPIYDAAEPEGDYVGIGRNGPTPRVQQPATEPDDGSLVESFAREALGVMRIWWTYSCNAELNELVNNAVAKIAPIIQSAMNVAKARERALALRDVPQGQDDREIVSEWRSCLCAAWASGHRAVMTILLESGPSYPARQAPVGPEGKK